MIIGIILIGTQTNTFVVKVVSLVGCQLIWITLNKADRLSLSDTDERVVVMKKELLNTRGGMVRLIKVIQLLGLTLALISIISHT